MSNNTILDYIRKNLASGHSSEDIRKELINSGWPKNEIDEAFENVRKKPNHEKVSHASKSNKNSPGVLKKLKMTVFQPAELFNQVKDERDFRCAFRFHVLLVVIELILVNIILYSLSQIASSSEFFSPLGIVSILSSPALYSTAVIVIFFDMITQPFSMFLGAGSMHIVAVIFGAKRGYINTYKTMVYSYTPMAILYPFALLSVLNPFYIIPIYALICVWTIMLGVKGFTRLQEVSTRRAAGISSVPFIVLGLVIWNVIMSSLGISGLQATEYVGKISNGFDVLGEPTDWDLYENGSFDITLYNQNSLEVKIKRIEASLRGGGPVSYEPDPPIVIAPNSTYILNSSESELNLGYQFFRNTYIIDIDIELQRGDADETDSGRVLGTIPSRVPKSTKNPITEFKYTDGWSLNTDGDFNITLKNIESDDILVDEIGAGFVDYGNQYRYEPISAIRLLPGETYELNAEESEFNFGKQELGTGYEMLVSIEYKKEEQPFGKLSLTHSVKGNLSGIVSE
jgi:hypothetical protein